MFGPRSTGKTFLIRKQLGEERYINLLRASDRQRFTEDAGYLRSYVNRLSPGLPVVIDEIQMIPELLNEVHDLIETTDHKFLLTGSSARKLKRANANMLGGRARYAEIFPLTWFELQREEVFDLNKYLLHGGIPRVYLSEDSEDELSDYVDTYLDQEIKAEAITRNILGFENFLAKLAVASGQTIVYQNIANDVQLSPPTVRQYMEVLEDTLITFRILPWQSPVRKAIQSAKIYFFDLGVRWFLSRVESLPEKSDLYGHAFEQFIIMEVRACLSYRRKREQLFFWRTTHQDEVDLIIGDEIAIEIKSSIKTNQRDAKSLFKLREEGFKGRLMVVSRDSLNRLDEGCEYLHWEEFLKQLWTAKW